MTITSWNIIGEGPESTAVILRLWAGSELEVRAAALRGAAALCDACWSAYEDHSRSRDGLSADVVYELCEGSGVKERTAVSAVMRAFVEGLTQTASSR
ncbi:MAG: hypothetical protein HYZ29_08570 [Myxococcales bacterium]|nr:hypothetical protein [Myxococcales bacterium]